jgi:penicillin amidase
VPGDGSYEWDGYLPITSLPNTYNPPKGFWVTANENLVPEGYEHRNAVGWGWADSYRADRINEVLGAGQKYTLEDMMKLQFDYLSLPARSLVPLLKNVQSTDSVTEKARMLLLQWNFILDKNSIEAGIYVAWEKKLSSTLRMQLVPENARKYIRSIPLSKVVAWLTTADPILGTNSLKKRDQLLVATLEDAVQSLNTRLGSDRSKWQYGQPAYHHVLIKHPLSNAVNDSTRKKLEAGPLPRGGNASTPGMTTNTDNQISGASFRMVADISDWDKTMFTNTPGQSGNPSSPYYRNLFELWANDQHFPVYFSREKVNASAAETITLNPR